MQDLYSLKLQNYNANLMLTTHTKILINRYSNRIFFFLISAI